MSEEKQEEISDLNVSVSKYMSERDYVGREYKPYLEVPPDMCGSCELYYKNVFDKNLAKKDFPPKCNRHILEEFKDLKPEDFDEEEEYNNLIINADPVAWAYKNFGWEARWYQEEMMSCTAQKKVVRAGRRTGKTTCIVVLIAYMLYTNEDFTILVIAPYQAQVTKIFDELNKLVGANEGLMGSIKRNTKNPHRFELNGLSC